MRKINLEVLNELKKFEHDAKSLSEKTIFLKIGEFDKKYCNDTNYIYNINGIIVNIGTELRNIKIITYAIKRLQKLIKKNKQNELFDKLYYDLGNAILTKADIKFGTNPKINDLINSTEYYEARKYYSKVRDPKYLLPSYTNIANILEKFGRNYEAIMFYDKALKIDPNFGMALGNKGIALTYYFSLSSKKKP